MSEAEFIVGSRVIFEEHLGTVCYFGSIDGQNGSWVGVDWDDPNRGKHDGSVGGKKYFESREPTSASFVRPRRLDRGHDFIAAVEDKYGEFLSDDDSCSEKEAESVPSHDLLVFDVKSKKNVTVDFVGGDRVAQFTSNWSALTRLNLERVNGIDLTGNDPNKLAAFSAVMHLLIRKNLIFDWQQIADICSVLPALKELDISENKLVSCNNISSLGNVKALSKVESLIAHRIGYSWANICHLSVAFPSLQQLGLCFNQIDSFQECSGQSLQVLSNLTVLDLVGNPIKSWDNVRKLGFMEKLKELHLDECDLEEIYFPDAKPKEKTKMFEELEQLTIDVNKIEQWVSVSELSKLKNLREIRLRRNPVYRRDNISPETARQQVIARLLELELLNGSPVYATERREAEIDYITALVQNFLDATKSNTVAEFEKEHPTFELLLDKYKLRRELLTEERPKENQSSSIIKIGFSKKGSTDQPIVRQISINVTIGKLKILAKRTLRLKSLPQNLALSYQSLKYPELLVSLDKDSKELYFYSIENGDTIVVSEHSP